MSVEEIGYTRNLNIQKGISTAEVQKSRHKQTLTYEPIYEGSNRQRIVKIQKKLVISEKEKVGVSLLIVNKEFSLLIQLGITEEKQVNNNQGQNNRDVKLLLEWKYKGFRNGISL